MSARQVAEVSTRPVAERSAPAPRQSPARSARKRRPRFLPRSAWPWWFAPPALAFSAFVVLIPSIRGSYYAFTDWDGLNPVLHRVGLANFRAIWNDDAARGAIRHTVLIAVAVTIVQNLIGL